MAGEARPTDGASVPVGADGRSPAGRVAGDERAADDARRRLREQGIVPVEADAWIGGCLRPGEQVLAVRHAAWIDRRQPRRDDSPGLCGDLYVTTRRLVHHGRDVVVYELEEIREADVVAGELRLILGDDRGLAIDVGDPRLLRVEIAAARAASREAAPA